MKTLNQKIKQRRSTLVSTSDVFRNESGAIDLASIMVGIIVIGLIGGVIAATVFAVIPWTQDNAAKQQLDSVVAAQSAYMGLSSSVPPGTPAGHAPNSYADSPKLEEAKLMKTGPSYCSVVTDLGKGYAAYSQAASGKIWSVTDKNTKPEIFVGTLPTDCQFITASASTTPTNKFASVIITAQNGSPTTNNGNGKYLDISSSADGTVLVATSNIGYVFKSSDGGVTWNPITALGTGSWQGAAVSADGTRIVVTKWAGGVHQSIDSGVTWTALSMPVSTVQWRDVEMSPDGKHIVAGVEGGAMYYSHNFGATWAQATNAVTGWLHFGVSDDGQTIVGASPGLAQLSISKDGGATWGLTAPAISGKAFYGVAVSADGKTILGGRGATDGLVSSTDGGITWKTSTGINADTWRGVAMSDDGTKMIATGMDNSYTDALYTSVDSGVTWQQQNIGGIKSQWFGATMSSNGSKFAFTSGSGTGQKIHTGEWK